MYCCAATCYANKQPLKFDEFIFHKSQPCTVDGIQKMNEANKLKADA